MKYNKLVRDRIPQWIKEKYGKDSIFYQADEGEYCQRLKNKLQEEVQEFLNDNTIEELADVLEVVYALAQALQIDKEVLEKVRLKKHQERGGFEQKIILQEVIE